MRVARHAVRLVQDDDLVGRAGLAVGSFAGGGELGESLHLLPDHLDAALVRRVQLQNSFPLGKYYSGSNVMRVRLNLIQ